MATHFEVGTNKIDKNLQEIEFNLNRTARRVHNLFKLRYFNDQMGFRPNQHLATSKALIELTYMLGDSNS